MSELESIYETYEVRKELQQAMRSFAISLNPAYFVTVNPNVPNMSLHQSRDALCEFDKRINRRFHNKQFCHVDPSERLFFIAFPEHLNSNLHYHMLTRVPVQFKPCFEIYAQYELRQVVPSASLHICKLKRQDDLRKVTYYSSTDNCKIENYDNFIISTEFMNLKKKY